MMKSVCSVGVAAFLLTMSLGGTALAENIVRDPERHPHHAFEAEPHALLSPWHRHGDLVPGVGFRGTVTLAHEGFIRSINDSVGLGFGLDWTRYHAYVPLVLQWNFWLTERWSVFAEPGVAIHWTEERFRRARPDFTVYGGARVRLADRVALTFRAGYPAISLGVSFLL